MTEAVDKQQVIIGLEQAWKQHPAKFLKRYLTTDFQDPRINLASVLTRHALIRLIDQRNPGRDLWSDSGPLRDHEVELAKAVTTRIARRRDRLAPFGKLGRAVNKVIRIIKPIVTLGHEISGGVQLQKQWRAAVQQWDDGRLNNPSVLECACGSANDYRCMDAYALAEFIDYTGIDLVDTNIDNAKAMFPSAKFAVGDISELKFEDSSFDCVVVFDLFEHLHPHVMEQAFDEIIRVGKDRLLLTFFNMQKIPEHVIKPHKTYHWNTLSLERIKTLLQSRPHVADINIESIYEINPVHFTTVDARNEDNWLWTVSLSK